MRSLDGDALIALKDAMQDIAVVIHDARHQLTHGLAEELPTIRPRPDECSAVFKQSAHIQFQSKLLPRCDKVRRCQRFTNALESAKVRLKREMVQWQFWLIDHGVRLCSVVMLTGFQDSEPSVRPAVLVVSVLPPAAVFLSSSPDDRIGGALGFCCKGEGL